MMNETLQKELSAHLRKITGRENFLRKWRENVKRRGDKVFSNDFKEEIEGVLHLRVKGYLDEKKFNFEKDRNKNYSRIIFDFVNNRLKIRTFKSHSFSEINILNDYEDIGEFIPRGFINALFIIKENIKKLENVDEIFVKFNSVIKLRKGIDIQFIKDNQLIRDRVKEITLKQDGEKHHYYERDIKIEIGLEEEYIYSNEWLYQDKIFRKILKLINKYEKNLRNIEQIKTELGQKIMDETKEVISNIDKMVLIEKLKE